MIKRTAREPGKVSCSWSGNHYWSVSFLSGSGSLGWAGRWHYGYAWRSWWLAESIFRIGMR